jgi:hypothetical protein
MILINKVKLYARKWLTLGKTKPPMAPQESEPIQKYDANSWSSTPLLKGSDIRIAAKQNTKAPQLAPMIRAEVLGGQLPELSRETMSSNECCVSIF